MKKLVFLSLALLLMAGSWSCKPKTTNNGEIANTSDQVEVYYFHFTARCTTCRGVEAETRTDLANLYGDKVPFQSVNLDEEPGKALGDKLQVAGQALVIVKGSTKIDITNEGFLYALNDPEKFKTIIKENVDPLLN